MASYMKNVAFSYRPSPSPVSRDTTFKTRTLSATQRTPMMHDPVCQARQRPASTQTIARMDKPAKKLIDVRDLMFFELKFYYGLDNRFKFRATSPIKPAPVSASNSFYLTNNSNASRQLYRTSTMSPRYRVFNRGIRINEGNT